MDIRVDFESVFTNLDIAKARMNVLIDAGLKPGDTFTHRKLKHITPQALTDWARMGIIEIESKQLVKNKRSPWEICEVTYTPEEFAAEIVNGNLKIGSFHTRNVYKVITLDFEEYRNMLIKEVMRQTEHTLDMLNTFYK